ncbi:hypothetical protein SADUNF_Sadunf16G0223100 [Salix dunnii]|uniref:cellulase n=1 Tax=Salix dunnii TaxID=1413687 RepID=A0A835JBD7_9ROSI|nr:hypothetical protein SADUNF_Sadunf16G0223100 [Salix dunnii]
MFGDMKFLFKASCLVGWRCSEKEIQRKIYNQVLKVVLWAAAWLHRATNDEIYVDSLGASTNTGGIRTAFSWDDKFLGAQLLVCRNLLICRR